MTESEKSAMKDLYGIGRQVTSVYEPVVENLQQVRMLARSFEKGVEELESSETAGSADAQCDTDADIGNLIRGLGETINSATSALDNAALTAHFRALENNCAQLDRKGRELSALSSLMLVTAANASETETVAYLVDELRTMSDKLRSESKSILVAFNNIRNVRNGALQSLQHARALTDAHSVHSSEVSTLSGTEADPVPSAAIELRRMSVALSTSIARIMPRVVACMQHPDAFSQRCDHAAQIAAAVEASDTDEAAKPALAALCAEQVRDMRIELHDVQEDTRAALNDIQQASAQAIAAFQKALQDDPTLRRMAEHQDATLEMRRSVTHIKEEADEALDDLETCQSVFAEFAKAFDRLNEMRQKVRLSSMNADLSERRSERNTPELREVTKAVGECANTCGQTIAGLNETFDRLKDAFSNNTRHELSGNVDAICAHLDASSQALTELTEAIEAMRTVQSDCAKTLEDLVANASEAEARISANHLALKMLDQIVHTFSMSFDMFGIEPEKVDGGLLDGIYAGYTIERERQVHRSVFGENLSEVAQKPDTAEQDPDDPLAAVLF